MGVFADYPGEEIVPKQPMVIQTRNVLDKYRENGGQYTEIVYENCGHSPHLENENKFIRDLIIFFESLGN